MLDITMQLDIPQVTTIIYHHMKQILLKKRKKYKYIRRLGQNSYVNKNYTYS